MIGISEAVYASLAFGLAGALGKPKLMGAMMSGMGFVGVLSPILMLSFKFLSGDETGWTYGIVFGFFGCCVTLQLMGLCLVNRIPSVPKGPELEASEAGSFAPKIGSRVE